MTRFLLFLVAGLSSAFWGAFAFGDESRWSLVGTWQGYYVCGQGKTGLQLVFLESPHTGVFRFFPLAENSLAAKGSFNVSASYSTVGVALRAGKWIERPAGYSLVGMTGTFSADGKTFSGRIANSACQDFFLRNEQPVALDESAMKSASALGSLSPSEIRKLQSALKELGFDVGIPDGLTGIKTQQAISQFLSSVGEDLDNTNSRQVLALAVAAVSNSQEPASTRRTPLSMQELREVENADSVKTNTRSETPHQLRRRLHAEALMPKLIGRWEGAIYDRRTRTAERISIEFAPRASSEPEAWLSVKLIHSTYGNVAYSLLYDVKSDYAEIAKADASVRERGANGVFQARFNMKLAKDGFGRDQIELTVLDHGRPEAYLIRDTRRKSDSESLYAKCEKQFDPWFRDRLNAWEQARKLKVEFFGGLRTYDEVQSSLAEAWSSVVMKRRFGMAVEDMDDDSFNGFLMDARDCAVTGAELLFDDLMTGVIDLKGAKNDWNTRTSPHGYGDKPTGILPTERRKVIERIAFSREKEQELAYSLAGLDTASTSADMDAILSRLTNDLNAISPSVLTAYLEAYSYRRALMNEKAAENLRAERRERALTRLQGVPFPYERIPVAYHSLIRDLVQGELDRLDGGGISYFGGFVAQSIELCAKPANLAERLSLVGLLSYAIERGTLGAAYGDNNAIRAWASTAGAQLNSKNGADTLESLGCDSRFLSIVLASLVDLTASGSGDDDGLPDLFVRTCSLDRSQAQCECIVREGRGAFPGISDTSYSRSVFSRIVSSNPLTGIKIATVCGVSKY